MMTDAWPLFMVRNSILKIGGLSNIKSIPIVTIFTCENVIALIRKKERIDVKYGIGIFRAGMSSPRHCQDKPPSSKADGTTRCMHSALRWTSDWDRASFGSISE